jgi:hypothetical protein
MFDPKAHACMEKRWLKAICGEWWFMILRLFTPL